MWVTQEPHDKERNIDYNTIVIVFLSDLILATICTVTSPSLSRVVNTRTTHHQFRPSLLTLRSVFCASEKP